MITVGGRAAIPGVHEFTSFCIILEDYLKLFISKMFPVIFSSFVDITINPFLVFVWKIYYFYKIVQKQQQCLISDIHPPEIVDVFQMKVANIWTNEWKFKGASAQINVRESINALVCNLWPLLCVNYKLWKRVQIILKILMDQCQITCHFVDLAN